MSDTIRSSKKTLAQDSTGCCLLLKQLTMWKYLKRQTNPHLFKPKCEFFIVQVQVAGDVDVMTLSPHLSRVVQSVKIHIFHRLGPVPKHRTPDSTQPHPLRIHPDWTSCQCEHHLHAWRGAPLWSVCHWQSSSLALKIDGTIKLA